MVKKIIFAIVVIAVFATIAYQLGWLSSEGENVFEDTRESVLKKSEDVVDKARDVMD